MFRFLYYVYYSKGVRAKPHKWQLQQNSMTTGSETKDMTEQQQTLSATKLTLPDETDLRPGIKNNGNSSPNLRRQQKTTQQGAVTNHKRTVSLNDIMNETNSCHQNIPEVCEYFMLSTLDFFNLVFLL